MNKADREELREILQGMPSVEANIQSGIDCTKRGQETTAETHFNIALGVYQRVKNRLNRLAEII